MSDIGCLHADTCAGCPLINLPYDAQLERKHTRVRHAFAHFDSLKDIPIGRIQPALPQWGYRTRAKLSVHRGTIGLFSKSNDRTVVDIPQCRVMSRAMAALVQSLRESLPESVFAIDVREVSAPGSAFLLTLVTERNDESLQAFADELQRNFPQVVGVALNIHGRNSPHVLGPNTIHLAGAFTARDKIGDTTHIATYGAFTQAHRAQAEAIHRTIADWLAPNGRVLDLYAGSGVIGLSLARRGFVIVAVERYGPACARIEEAAREAGLRVAAIEGDATQVLSRKEIGPFDAVIVNPPRRGLTPELRRALVSRAPQQLAYLSCSPETLARDLSHFVDIGFVVRNVLPIDMIPQTDQVESLVLLDNAKTTDRGPARLVDPYAMPSQESAWMPGTSGCLRPEWSKAETTFVSLVVGITHAKGRIGDGRTPIRYIRKRVVGGHSLIEWRGKHADTGKVAATLRKLKHPIAGDPGGHAPSNRHFLEAHGLDRPFIHALSVHSPDHIQLAREPIRGDLSLVLESLERKRGNPSFESM